jgi:signal transduction histidine kinase
MFGGIPMNAILGMADLLWETELSEDQRDYVGRFRRAGASLLALINDILDLSKIESGRFELETVEFFLLDVVDRTMELMRPRAPLKKINRGYFLRTTG